MKYYSRVEVMNEMAKIETTNIDGNQMQLVLAQCEVNNDKEPKAIPFEGFNGEAMALKITPDCGPKKHDHLELYLGNKYLGYLHIDSVGVYFWNNMKHSKLQFKDTM